jgi:tRNA-dihydrouridine synthase B
VAMDFVGKLYLAPLAGVADSVFRTICRRHGAEVVVSEMVSADGLEFRSGPTCGLCQFTPGERPIGIQLFGSKPDHLAHAAAYVEEMFTPDFIDLNSGCPVPKVVQKNGGAALLKDLALFEQIVAGMVRAVHKTPVTVKLRSAWKHGDWIDAEFARAAENAGAAAVILHPRSKTMGFSGQALWERIALTKKAVRIPVIGNGDIQEPDDARRMLAETGCDAVMIGRGALGNPWIFSQARQILSGQPASPVSRRQRIDGLHNHIDQCAAAHGEALAYREMKKHFGWYLKGLPGSSAVRTAAFSARSTAELKEILNAYASSDPASG